MVLTPLRRVARWFQSTPVIANGRIGAGNFSRRFNFSFNPRPLLLTGESCVAAGHDRHVGVFQSTPVIANGRIPGRPDLIAAVADQFQSTPVIANGRIPQRSLSAGGLRWFQSTPVIANGRIHPREAKELITKSFQSTPVIANGRIGPRREQAR